MKLGNRATLTSIQRRTVDVEFQELDTAYRLREMSGTERDTFEIASVKTVDGARSVDAMYLRARLVALCLVDEQGNRLYADDEVHQLSDGIPAMVIAKLFDAAQRLNGLGAEAAEAAEKNSASATVGDSSSA